MVIKELRKLRPVPFSYPSSKYQHNMSIYNDLPLVAGEVKGKYIIYTTQNLLQLDT